MHCNRICIRLNSFIHSIYPRLLFNCNWVVRRPTDQRFSYESRNVSNSHSHSHSPSHSRSHMYAYAFVFVSYLFCAQSVWRVSNMSTHTFMFALINMRIHAMCRPSHAPEALPASSPPTHNHAQLL